MSPSIERRGRIVAPTAAHIHLSALMPRVYAIASFDDTHSPKTQRAMIKALREHAAKYHTESTYAGLIDGKRTYDCLIYSSKEERVACFTYLANAKTETAQ